MLIRDTGNARPRLNILYLSDFLPHTSAGNAGSGIFAYYIKEMHRRGHQISALSIAHPDDISRPNDLAQYCTSFKIVPNQLAVSERLRKLLLSFVSPWEYALSESLRIKTLLVKLFSNNRFDIVHAVHPWLIRAALESSQQSGSASGRRPVVLGHVMDIVSGVFYDRVVASAQPKRTYRALRYAQMSLFEFTDYARVHGLLVHSAYDQTVIQAFLGQTPAIFMSPVWFDAIESIVSTITIRNSSDLLYVGNSNDPRMHEALSWFLQLAFPLALAEIPSLTLHIVSVQPQHMHLWQGIPHVVCHPIVPTTELLSLYDQSRAMIFPLRRGHYSVHVKVLNAFARGCPVIMTPEANFAQQAHHNVEALIAKRPDDFAKQIVNIFNDPACAMRIANGAQQKLRLTYTSPSTVADSLETAYFETLANINPNG